ncbi:MAG: hypothetical protein NVSMB6_15540 [Burkholderiaceae bacterium]
MKLSAELPIIGMDIAKNVFQLHIVDPETSEVERKKLKRDRVAPFFANRPCSVVALAACGGAHYGPYIGGARSPGQAAACQSGQALCGARQERCP